MQFSCYYIDKCLLAIFSGLKAGNDDILTSEDMENMPLGSWMQLHTSFTHDIFPSMKIDHCWAPHCFVVVSFFSVVEFANESDMRRAIKRLDSTELLGKRIRLLEVTCPSHITVCI